MRSRAMSTCMSGRKRHQRPCNIKDNHWHSSSLSEIGRILWTINVRLYVRFRHRKFDAVTNCDRILFASSASPYRSDRETVSSFFATKLDIRGTYILAVFPHTSERQFFNIMELNWSALVRQFEHDLLDHS